LAAFFSSLRKNIDNDEPIDSLIYMISAALGFSAMENSFFLFKALNSGALTQSIISGNMRFIGATLLHVASSALVGAFLAFGFFKDNESKKMHLFTGLVLAIVLHTIFNWFIIKAGENLFFVFGGVWLSIIAIIFTIEKVKTLKNQ
jgi:RsiW-degrading membrane proteinase PrsW (M82 family)